MAKNDKQNPGEGKVTTRQPGEAGEEENSNSELYRSRGAFWVNKWGREASGGRAPTKGEQNV